MKPSPGQTVITTTTKHNDIDTNIINNPQVTFNMIGIQGVIIT